MNQMQPTKDERMWTMFAHMSGVVGALLSVNFLPFLGPLIIWLVKKDESDFVDDQGKEALNFSIDGTRCDSGSGRAGGSQLPDSAASCSAAVHCGFHTPGRSGHCGRDEGT